MPQGLQVFDYLGNVVVDTSDTPYKEVYETVATSDGSYTLPSEYNGQTIVAVSDQNPSKAALDLITDNTTTYWKFQGGGGSGYARIRVAIV